MDKNELCIKDNTSALPGCATEELERRVRLCYETPAGLYAECAGKGHTQLCVWLHANYGDEYELLSEDALKAAASNGRVETCQWLTKQHPNTCRKHIDIAFKEAFRNGHSELYKWLVDDLDATPWSSVLMHFDQNINHDGWTDVCRWYLDKYDKVAPGLKNVARSTLRELFIAAVEWDECEAAELFIKRPDIDLSRGSARLFSVLLRRGRNSMCTDLFNLPEVSKYLCYVPTPDGWVRTSQPSPIIYEFIDYVHDDWLEGCKFIYSLSDDINIADHEHAIMRSVFSRQRWDICRWLMMLPGISIQRNMSHISKNNPIYHEKAQCVWLIKQLMLWLIDDVYNTILQLYLK
jgi:hypothetical protein